MAKILDDYKDANIFKKSPCENGQHSWTWTSSITETEDPPKDSLCECGLYKFSDFVTREERDASDTSTVP